MAPNTQRTACVLPQRIDVGRHFIMTGGPDAVRETVASMTSRVQSFGQYITNLTVYPAMASLFADEKFQRVAAAVCPVRLAFLFIHDDDPLPRFVFVT